MQRLYKKAEELFGVDSRSLGLLRISLGLLLLYDLLIRSADVTAHYTNAGILPREVLYEEFPYLWYLSIHVLSGEAAFQAGLFVLAGLAALALLVGYRTRLTTVLCWFLLLSLHARNPIILNRGDIVLRLLLFWSLFLPLGRRFSVDSYLKGTTAENRFLSVATLGMLLQVCFIYWFSVLWKSHPVWTTEFSALYYALSLDRHVTSIGQFLLSAPPELLQGLTLATLGLELIGPMVAFFPVHNGFLRTGVVAAFIGFHFSLSLTMALGIFPFVCMAAWLVFLPTWFWERIATFTKLPKTGSSRISLPSLSVSTLSLNFLAALSLWYVFAYNIDDVGWSSIALHESLQYVAPMGAVAGLNQSWSMFASRPTTDDGWYVIEGQLEDGKTVNAFSYNSSLHWCKPALVSATYKNQRWRKYLGERLLENKEVLAPHLARYLWQRWHASHAASEQLATLSVYLMYERNLPDFESFPPEKRLIVRMSAENKIFVPETN